jgi:hypothetical protein
VAVEAYPDARPYSPSNIVNIPIGSMLIVFKPEEFEQTSLRYVARYDDRFYLESA